MKRYREWSPTQSFLMPPSPMDWLPEGHLAYFILDVVPQLDLGEIERAIQHKDHRGERPYSPQMMVALLLYAYCIGVFSSRKIARATHEDVAFRILAGGTHPHFTTINDFRLQHREAFKNLFVQALLLCQRAGMVKLGHIAFDGSKVRANASKHKAMSYDRMREEEQRLTKEIEELLARAERVDQDEDARLGTAQQPEDIPAELARREARLERIREAKAALEAEAKLARAQQLRELAATQRAKADDPSEDDVERKRAETRARKSDDAAAQLTATDDRNSDDDDASGGTPVVHDPDEDLPTHRVPTNTDGTPKDGAQRNFTDPDSRIMMENGAFIQGYNAQIAVDDAHQVIVAQAVTNQAPDQEHLRPMTERVIGNCAHTPERASADNGYYSQANVEHLEARGIDPYLAVGRKNEQPASSTPAETPAQQVRERMRAKLQSDAGKAIYARRKTIVEPPFGQIKEARRFRRFSLRGIVKVRCEWALVCLTHNLLKLFRCGMLPAAAPA